MKTNYFRQLLIAIVAMLCSVAASAYDFEADGIFYHITSHQGLKVGVTYKSFKSGTCYSGNVVIPESVTYNGKTYSVTSIEISAFNSCQKLRSVKIPNSVTTIRGSAFNYCTGLESVEIPNSVTKIEEHAFYFCKSLTNVTIPNGIKEIEKETFYYCSKLTNVTIPNGVTEIGVSAFGSCYSLSSVTIPASVTNIGYAAFGSCSNLKTVINYSNITILKGEGDNGLGAATNIINAPNASIEGDFVFSKFRGINTLSAYIGNEKYLTLPENYNGSDYVIGASAFSICSGLKSVTIPNSVTSIGENAFYGCSELTNITIPNSVTSIEKNAFYNCSGFTSITIPNSVTSIGSDAFKGCSNITSVTLECNEIGNWFHGNTTIKNIVIGDNVRTIVKYAFENCKGLTSVTIGNSVTSIGASAFHNCSNLESVTLNCNKIGVWFMGDTSIKNLVIGDNVTTVTSGAFKGCKGLTNVTIGKSVTTILSSAFDDCNSIASLTLNCNEISNWFKGYASIKNLVIGDNVTKIDKEAFYNCNGLTSVTIGNNVTNIESNAFYGCYNLTSVTIPDKVKSIGDNAFYNCNGLTSATIGNSVTSIGNYAFYNCSGLANVTIPNSVTSIGDYAFHGCSRLKSVTIPNSVTSIGDYAFYNCSELANVTIPNSVTSIGNYAFYGCSRLTSMTIHNGMKSIGDYAFYNCSELDTVINFSALKISKGSTSNGYIGYYADKVINAYNGSIEGDFIFVKRYDGENILQGYIGNDAVLTLPENYNGNNYVIGDSAFIGCSKLTSVTIPNSVTKIEHDAFNGCSKLTSVTIPNSVTKIGTRAFNGCTSLKDLRIEDGTETLSLAYNYFNGSGQGKGLFYDCPLETIHLGRDIEYDAYNSYGNSPFYAKSTLKSVTIGNSVTSIGNYAFASCSGLASVTIPNSVTSIGKNAFYGCSLTSITIPNSVTSIGDRAFYNCNLTSITIPNSVTSIGDEVFYGVKPTNIVVESGNSVYDSRDNCNAIIETETNTLIQGCKNTIIPNGVTSIGENAFYGFIELTNITIPNSVTSIGKNAFYGCILLKTVINFSSLTISAYSEKNGLIGYYANKVINAPNGSIEGDFVFGKLNGNNTLVQYIGDASELILPDNYKGGNYDIGEKAFYDYSKLTSVIIPNGVTGIGKSAFEYCDSLTSVVVPNSVTNIGGNAFYNCSRLTSVTIPNSVTDIGYTAFGNCKEVHINDIAAWCNIKFGSVPFSNEHSLYLNGELVTELVIPDSVTSIGGNAFYNCSGLTSITIPNSVTSIGSYAFKGCSNLGTIINFSSLAIVKGSTENGYVGYYANEVTSAPNGSIEGDFVFSKLNGINTLVKYLGNATELTLPDNYKGESYTIGEKAFYNSGSLTNVTIPKGVTSIGKSAFDGCAKLTNMLYTSTTPPASLWLATNTYVPNKDVYTNSAISGGSGNLIEYVTFQNTNFVYGDTLQTAFTNNLENLGYTASLISSELNQNVGTYTVDFAFTFTKGNNQFNANCPFKYTVNKASLVVKADSNSRLYGENNSEFLISYSGFVNGEDESVLINKGTATTSATAKSDVGIYDIVVSGVTSANYEIQYEKGTLTVKKAPLNVSVNNATRVYGDENSEFTLSYSGLKNGETSPEMTSAFNISTDATKFSNVGEYDIVVSGGDAKNYEIMNYTNGKLTVTKAPLTVAAKSATRVYGDANPLFKYSYNGAKNNDDESSIFETQPTISCIASETSNVGEYDIEIGDALSNNYEISYKNGTLSINKREITVSTKNYTRIYGEENPDFEISYSGFANNEDESALLIKPKAKTIAEKDSDAGVYDINIEGGDDENYSFTYGKGTLTIKKANQTITWEQDFNEYVVGSQIELTAKSSSGLDIEYIIPDNNFIYVYTIDGTTYLDCYDAGEITIRATQNGNKNYNAAVRVSKVIKIVPTSISDVHANATVKVNANSITLIDANNSSVSIYNTSGALIEKIDNYNGENIMLDKGIYIISIGNKTIKIRL